MFVEGAVGDSNQPGGRIAVDTINYDDWKKRRGERRAATLGLENSFVGRAAGMRPRDPKKEEILARMTRARIARYIESGKLEIIDSKHWKWRVDFRSNG